MDPRIRVEVGRQRGAEFEIPPKSQRELTILGRGKHCDVRFRDPQLSREHCRFSFDGRQLYVEDMESRNGTRVNGELITGPVVLNDGDRIGVGSSEIVVSFPTLRTERATLTEQIARRGPQKVLAEEIDALEGKEFAGYNIEEKICDSGIYAVFKARDTGKNMPVAMKLIRPDADATMEEKNRFIRGAREIATVHHHNIARVFKGGKARNVLYVAMEYVPGKNVEQIVQQAGRPLEAKAAAGIAAEALAALQAIYEKELVMRAVRADNIIVQEDRKVKLVDFDMVKPLPKEGESEVTRVVDGGLSIDPSFAAPELIVFAVSADQRSDVFGIGACLYYMLTGSAPFSKTSLSSVPSKVFSRMMIDAAELNPEIPDSVNAVINKALDEQPRDRFQTPAEMRAALTEAMASL